TFVVGDTHVACTARDSRGNVAAGGFVVHVVDTTPPTLTLRDVTADATGPTGAGVLFGTSANDLVDGVVQPQCVPARSSARSPSRRQPAAAPNRWLVG